MLAVTDSLFVDESELDLVAVEVGMLVRERDFDVVGDRDRVAVVDLEAELVAVNVSEGVREAENEGDRVTVVLAVRVGVYDALSLDDAVREKERDAD